MASSWDKGDRVKIRGLTSEAGLQLNGQLGRVTQLANETGRLEVGLDGGRLVRVKAESLQLQDEVDDSSWSSGDQVRLVGLSATQEEELQKLHSSLGFLHRRLPRQKWSVQVQAKTYILHARHLRVCTKAENACWGSAGRRPLLLGAGLAATVLVLIGSELACRRLSRLRLTGEVPGPASAALPLVATSGSLLWIVATVCGCYAMHRSLMDPEVPFPQISELAVGPDAAKLLYRVGFASSAALLASVVQLHRDLGLPHLPGGRAGEAGEEFSFYGLLAAGGVALQGVALLDPAMTLQTMLHLAGALVFFWASWCHTSAAAELYLPGWSMPAEESPEYQQVVDAMEAAEDSKLLAVPAVWWLVRIRHKVLMRGPLAMFLGPLVMQFLERSQDRETGMAQSPRTRNWMGILQWLVVANFALIFFSYGPELAIAAMLPLPQED